MNKRRQVNLYKLKKWVEDKKKTVPLKKNRCYEQEKRTILPR